MDGIKRFWVYIITSQKNGSLYTGVTSSLSKRMYVHKEGLCKGHAEKYGINRLVYYEEYANSIDAITREKQIKKWRRSWKIKRIEESNFNWEDLYQRLNR